MRRTPDNFPSVLITLHYHTQHIVIPLRFIPDFRTIFIYTGIINARVHPAVPIIRTRHAKLRARARARMEE